MLRRNYEGCTCALKVKEWFLQMNACCLVILAVDSSVCMVVFFLFIDICFVSWGSCQHAWYRLGKSCGFGWWVHWIERKIRQGTCFRICDSKTHSFCIFDIVNKKTPSVGMIGPGNCQWLHNTLLFLSGAIGPGMQKLLKNHAAVHDACGFVLTHTDIRSGYFPKMQ